MKEKRFRTRIDCQQSSLKKLLRTLKIIIILLLCTTVNLLANGTSSKTERVDWQMVLTSQSNGANKDNIFPSPEKKMIRGKVLDSKGVPLPGATVVIVGTTNGGVTDASGYYTLEANTGDILRFSFIGYKLKEVTVGEKTAIDVILQEDITMLDEAAVSYTHL